MREALTVGLFSTFVLLIFLIFVFTGFLHGAPDVCLLTNPDGCYCEYFDKTKIGTFGVRQPWNTWSNLMGIVYGSIVAWAAWSVRTGDTAPFNNRMRDNDKGWYPLIYICVVTFLGLGSMWFHGSIVHWAGYIDLLSMFMFVCFILFYSWLRCRPIVDDTHFKEAVFLMGYFVVVFAITTIVYVKNIDSVTAIIPIIALALGMEIANFFINPDGRSDWRGYVIIGIGVLSFGAAALFRSLGVTGGPLCFPHGFQAHALWHWLAGVTSMCFYFYWIRCRT